MKFCPPDLWDSLARADDTATFFQTPAWHRIAARHFRAESAPLLFEFGDGPACLPLLRQKRWGRWRYFSPFGTYTAVLCPRPLSPSETAVIENTLADLNLQLISSPFTRNPVAAGTPVPARSHVLDLEQVDPGNVIKGWEKGQQRWSRATTSYPPSVFDDIRDLPGGEADRTLWLAEHNGAIGAGVLAFRHHRHMAVWHSAADARFFEAGATQLLYLHMIGDAAREGHAALDFLGSAGLKGVEAFKTRFGALPRDYASFINRRGVVGLLGAWRARLRGMRGAERS
jgi:hypothetical protein